MVDVADILNRFGIPWPDADTSKARQAAADWRALGAAIENSLARGNNVARAVAENNSGSAVTAFTKFWDSIGGTGDQSLLPSLTRACAVLADHCDKFADAVDETKHKLEATAVEIAAAITTGALATLFTVGIADMVSGAVTAGLAATALGELAVLGTTVSEIAAALAASVSEALSTAVFQTVGANTAAMAMGEQPESLSLSEAAVRVTAAGLGTATTIGASGAVTEMLGAADGLSAALPQLPATLAAIAGALKSPAGKIVTDLASNTAVNGIVNGRGPENPSPKEVISSVLTAEIEARLLGRD